MRLERRLAVFVVAEIHEQALHGITKSPVLRVLLEVVGIRLQLVDDAVGVAAIALAEELMALVVDVVPLVGGRVLHDEALLLQTLADEVVELAEPVLQLPVVVGITVDGVDGVHDVVEGGVVGESLDQGLEISQRWSVRVNEAWYYLEVSLSHL